MRMRRFFCFAHIPKTAGTTFNSIMERNFGDDYLRVPHDFYEEGPLKSQFISAFIERFPNRRALGGHRVSLDLEFDMPGADLRAIAFVREPLDRLVSEYFYLRRISLTGEATELQQDTFEKFVEAAAAKANSWFQNAQCQFVQTKLPELAELVEAQKVFLFTMDTFENACICLENFFPSDFLDCSYVEKNVNGGKAKAKPRPSLTGAVAKLVGLDQQLYELAQLSQSRLFEEIGDPAHWNELKADFRRRCVFRRLIIGPSESLFLRGNHFFARKKLRFFGHPPVRAAASPASAMAANSSPENMPVRLAR